MTRLGDGAGPSRQTLGSLGVIGRYVNVRRLILAGALLAGLFAGLAYFQSRGGSDSVLVEPARLLESAVAGGGPKVAPEKGSLAPDFEVSGFDGRRFRLSDLRGAPAVVKFWATWCSSCLAEFPHLKELRERHQADGWRILAVNAGESYGAAKEYADFLDAPFDWALDPTLTVADGYRVVGFPVSVFVDREGVIQAVRIGEMDAELMEEYAMAAISAVPAAEAPPKFRFVTTLARDNVVVVRRSTTAGELLLASQRFRCDPAYCLDALPAELPRLPGVRGAEFDRVSEPPELRITFDPNEITLDEIVAQVTKALEAHPDPLYRRPLEVTYEGE